MNTSPPSESIQEKVIKKQSFKQLSWVFVFLNISFEWQIRVIMILPLGDLQMNSNSINRILINEVFIS